MEIGGGDAGGRTGREAGTVRPAGGWHDGGNWEWPPRGRGQGGDAAGDRDTGTGTAAACIPARAGAEPADAGRRGAGPCGEDPTAGAEPATGAKQSISEPSAAPSAWASTDVGRAAMPDERSALGATPESESHATLTFHSDGPGGSLPQLPCNDLPAVGRVRSVRDLLTKSPSATSAATGGPQADGVGKPTHADLIADRFSREASAAACARGANQAVGGRGSTARQPRSNVVEGGTDLEEDSQQLCKPASTGSLSAAAAPGTAISAGAAPTGRLRVQNIRGTLVPTTEQ